MIVLSVILFLLGIYIQAVGKFGLYVPVFFLSLFLLVSVLTYKRYPPLSLLAVLLCVFFAGMFRIGPLMLQDSPGNLYKDIPLFYCTVVEREANNLILAIEYPHELKKIKAVFRSSNTQFEIGDTLLIYGRLKEMAPRYRNPHMISWTWVKSVEGVGYVIEGRILRVNSSDRLISRLRTTVRNRIERLRLSNEGVIKALALGDKGSIGKDIQDLFLRTGTSHVLAISGLHMGVISGFVFFALKWILSTSYKLRLSGDDKKLAALMSLPFIVFFMYFFGASPSTIRAATMIGIYAVSLVIERERELISTIALSCLLILLYSPHSLFSPSFQLSFMSVLFIVLIGKKVYPYLERIKNKFWRWILISFITTKSAMLGTVPLVLYHFHGMNFFTPLYNLVTVPMLCGIGVPFILAGSFLPYGEVLLKIADLIIAFNIDLLKSLEYGYLYPLFRPTLFEAILYYSALLSLIYIRKKAVRSILLFVLTPVLLINGWQSYTERYGDRLCVNFLDVGIGEATLVEAPYGKRIMIDAGGSYGVLNAGKSVIMPILLSKKILTLDYLVITHAHEDHTGGANHLVENLRVKNVVITGETIQNEKMLSFLDTVRKKGTVVNIVREGDKIVLGSVSLIVLNPPKDFLFDDTNDNSLVLKLSHKDVSFLFTGDITYRVENKLTLDCSQLKADCLKVPHHGSLTSSSVPFLSCVDPKIAILSVPHPRYPPSLRVLERYSSLRIPVLSTYEHGCVRICVKKDRIYVKTYGEPPGKL